MKEKLELVTDFGSLKAGMIVLVKCNACQQMHRRFLLRLDLDVFMEDIAGNRWVGPKWIGYGGRPKSCPYTDTSRWPTPRAGVSEKSVLELRVYRVVDGLEQSTELRKSVTT